MNLAPAISIVVTAHNEGDCIAECLRSLAAQRGTLEFEILLVDDRSTDDTAQVALGLKLENFSLIRLDHFDHPGLTARQVALDAAFKAARGEVVFLTDADAIVPPDWVSSMCAKMKNSNADAVAGPVQFLPRTNGRNRTVALLQTADNAFYTGVCAVLNRLGFASGFVFGNCAFRRECFEKIGGFASIGFALTEDLAFARALRAAGLRIAFVAKPAVAVRACGSLPELMRRAQRISEGGVSALSISLGVWMVAWVVLGIGAVAFPLVFAVPFLVRYLLGAGFVAWWLSRCGRSRLLLFSLIYEPVAFIAGLCVLLSGHRKSSVAWGGLDYERRLF
ncbi:MAG: glycosyltransferase family 2 protein [Verrucomicrobiales bacterium]